MRRRLLVPGNNEIRRKLLWEGGYTACLVGSEMCIRDRLEPQYLLLLGIEVLHQGLHHVLVAATSLRQHALSLIHI